MGHFPSYSLQTFPGLGRLVLLRAPSISPTHPLNSRPDAQPKLWLLPPAPSPECVTWLLNNGVSPFFLAVVGHRPAFFSQTSTPPLAGYHHLSLPQPHFPASPHASPSVQPRYPKLPHLHFHFIFALLLKETSPCLTGTHSS